MVGPRLMIYCEGPYHSSNWSSKSAIAACTLCTATYAKGRVRRSKRATPRCQGEFFLDTSRIVPTRWWVHSCDPRDR